ncbi:50S ribosomal protein L17 [Balneola sp. MJW-20]|uniref:50S ribosomal protein L17 n=1 Tax=Gracilimonas aurantiaca TaxID=3234185 RepID=UPI0039095231
MRHRVKGNNLSRKAGHRKATLQALSIALIKEHRIVTTVAKAKALRTFVEPLITRAKEDNQKNRTKVFSALQNKEAVKMIFDEVGPASKDRPGGYTRVIKAGFRKGDGAEMAVIELVDFNDIQPEGASSGGGKKRTRRAGKSNTPTSATPSKKEETKKEEAKAEAEETATTEVEEEAAESAEEVKAEEAAESTEGSEDSEEEEEKK